MRKKKLFDEIKGRYALKSMFAGAYLPMSTPLGILAADLIFTQFPALGRFTFTFIFAIGRVFVLIFNEDLATSNMMYLTTGSYYKKSVGKKQY